jgi:NAD(P)-dependent dehydrogenase (short-subunit alcohol dehydrogenase family)
MNQLKKYAIVTGAGSGLGRAIARRLGRRGWHLALADVNLAGVEETARLVAAEGGTSQPERLDVSDPQEWQELRDRLQARWERLDLLVNNAGVGGSGECGAYSLDDWRWLLGVNLYGGVYGCHTMVDWLKANPHGAHIINTCSFAAFGSAPAMAAYNVSKAGMLSLSETLYAELRPHGVGVTALCPIFFQTNLLENARLESDAQREIAAGYMRSARFGADDVAAAALAAMDRKRLYVVMGRKARVYWLLKRYFPRVFLWIVSRAYARMKRARQSESAADQTEAPLQTAGSSVVGK